MSRMNGNSTNVWNKKKFKLVKKLMNKYFNKIIAHVLSFMTMINNVTFFLKKSIFDVNKNNVNLFFCKMMNWWMKYHISKMKFFKSCFELINSSIRKKTAKTKQQKTCHIEFFWMFWLKWLNNFNKTFFIIDRHFHRFFVFFCFLMSVMMCFNHRWWNIFKSRNPKSIWIDYTFNK